MTILNSEIYDALKDAGTAEAKARAAAESVAGYDNRFTKMEHEIRLLQWMVGGIYALLIPIFLRLFLGGK
jgi:hypothetical protein